MSNISPRHLDGGSVVNRDNESSTTNPTTVAQDYMYVSAVSTVGSFTGKIKCLTVKVPKGYMPESDAPLDVIPFPELRKFTSEAIQDTLLYQDEREAYMVDKIRIVAFSRLNFTVIKERKK